MIYEEQLRHDPEAVCHTFRAFNRWLRDDWGFVHADRIFAAPYITLADARWAVEELEWALGEGARLLVMRPAAPTTALGRRSPFDPMFDPFWARVDEAGVTVVVHAGDSGVSSDGYAVDGFAATFGGGYKPSLRNFAIERAVHDFLLSMVLENQFRKFPNLRVASVENGAEFLPDLFRKLRSVDRKMRGWFADDPVDVFRRHIWINPFWEDDLASVVDWMGADRVLFGSDWPHIEGLPRPLDYLREAKVLAPDDRRMVLHDNVRALTTPRPRRRRLGCQLRNPSETSASRLFCARRAMVSTGRSPSCSVPTSRHCSGTCAPRSRAWPTTWPARSGSRWLSSWRGSRATRPASAAGCSRSRAAG